MAGTQVPGIDNSPQFNTSVPGVALPRRQEFTEMGQSIERAGGRVEQLASSGAELYDEVQRQHDIATASQAHVDAGVAHAQQLQNLKLVSPDGFVHDPNTNEIEKGPDGKPRTIAQDYWSWADSDYQERQKSMSPRAAAMFRAQMQPEIGTNTRHLQTEQLQLQRQDATQKFHESLATLARDNDRNPFPDLSPYYYDKRPDGSINMRGSTDKINGQLQQITLQLAQKGPVHGAPGMFNPEEIRAMTAKALGDHAENWMRSSVTDMMENDTPRDHKNKVSTTALQQVMNLRDIVEGKDPQSLAAAAKSLPTVNKSLSSEQIDKWRNQLNGMLDGAQKIDRSEYELALQQMKAAAKSGAYGNFDLLVNSPEFQHIIHAREPLGITDDKFVSEVSEIFGNAAKSAGHFGVTDLASDAVKRRMIEQNLRSFELGWQQFASMSGAKFVGGMDKAILGEAGRHAYTQHEEEQKRYQEDPAKFAAELSSAPQDPNKGLKYRSAIMHAVGEKLFADPSMEAPLTQKIGGKPLIVSAISEMTRIGSMGFGQGYDPLFLSKNDYQAWASKIKDSAVPEQVQKMFTNLKQMLGENSAHKVLDQLVRVGGLDPSYMIAQNLPPVAQIDAIAEIKSKGGAIEMLAKTQGKDSGETRSVVMQKAYKALSTQLDYNNKWFGADSKLANDNNQAALNTWASAYATSRLGGAKQDAAALDATNRVAEGIPPVKTVQDSAHFMGMDLPWHSGAASQVRLSNSNISPEKQKNITDYLLQKQKMPIGDNTEIVPAPIKQGGYDFNKKLTPKWVSEHPFIWYPVGKGENARYRLKYQGINADGSPNGRGYDLRIYGPHGDPIFYEVKESDALKGVK